MSQFQEPKALRGDVTWQQLRAVDKIMDEGFAVEIDGELWKSDPDTWSFAIMSREPECWRNRHTIRCEGHEPREVNLVQIALAARFQNVKLFDAGGERVDHELLMHWASDYNAALFQWRMANQAS
jgi:hypothetical protein